MSRTNLYPLHILTNAILTTYEGDAISTFLLQVRELRHIDRTQ